MVNILDTQNEGHPIEAPTVPHSVPPFKMASVATTKILEGNLRRHVVLLR